MPLSVTACSAASELHVPYIFPQESGGRADVRWLKMMPDAAATTHSQPGEGPSGLAAFAAGSTPTMQMNVSRSALSLQIRLSRLLCAYDIDTHAFCSVACVSCVLM